MKQSKSIERFHSIIVTRTLLGEGVHEIRLSSQYKIVIAAGKQWRTKRPVKVGLD